MDVIILPSEQFKELLAKVEEVKNAVLNSKSDPGSEFLDNQQFIEFMNISKRTAQSWRDEGIISFSQVGSKIYYRKSDVQKLLDSNYRKAFKSTK